MKNADMPAMPAGKISVPAPKGGDPLGNYAKTANGLTKREHFAAMAMQGILSNEGFLEEFQEEGWAWVATHAVKQADILLAELEKTK